MMRKICWFLMSNSKVCGARLNTIRKRYFHSNQLSFTTPSFKSHLHELKPPCMPLPDTQ